MSCLHLRAGLATNRAAAGVALALTLSLAAPSAAADGGAIAAAADEVSNAGATDSEVVPAHSMTSLLGGRTFGARRDSAARFELGWPELRLTWVLPFTRQLDISPQLTVPFGGNLRADFAGIEPGVEIKWNFWNDGAWSMAFLANPALEVHIPYESEADGVVAARIGGPGLVMGYQASNKLAINGGLRLPISISLQSDPVVLLPVVVDGGFEYEIVRVEGLIVNLHGLASMGPDICVAGCEVDESAALAGPPQNPETSSPAADEARDTVEFAIRLQVGASFIW